MVDAPAAPPQRSLPQHLPPPPPLPPQPSSPPLLFLAESAGLHSSAIDPQLQQQPLHQHLHSRQYDRLGPGPSPSSPSSPHDFCTVHPHTADAPRPLTTHSMTGPTLQSGTAFLSGLHYPMKSYQTPRSHLPPQQHSGPSQQPPPPPPQQIAYPVPQHHQQQNQQQHHHQHHHQQQPSPLFPEHPFSSFGSHYHLHQQQSQQQHVASQPRIGDHVPLRPMPHQGSGSDAPAAGRPMLLFDDLNEFARLDAGRRGVPTPPFDGSEHQQQQATSTSPGLGATSASQATTPSSGASAKSIAGRAPARSRNAATAGIAPGATSNITPVKTSNGKFGCEFCSKQYLHAKHLKRHMLRHTGDRPYACVLCNDTFSRSDILKRHFAKCSLRRGNPLNLSHLSHAAHLRKKNKEPKQRDQRSASDSPGRTSPGRKSSGKACDMCVRMKVKCSLGEPCERCSQKGIQCTYEKNQRRSATPPDSAHSRQDYDQASLLEATTGYGDGFNFPPPTHPHAHMTQHGHQQVFPSAAEQRPAHLQPLDTHKAQTQPAHYYGSAAESQSSTPVVWSSFEQQQQVPDTPYQESYYSQHGTVLHQAVDSAVTAGADGMYAMLYGPAWAEGSPVTFPGWDPKSPVSSPSAHPLQMKTDRLLDFLFGPRSQPPSPSNTPQRRNIGSEHHDDLRSWITPQNLKEFIKLFFHNFQNHFPLLHVPTFNTSLTYEGLLAAMFCIGAVYTNAGITHDQVRRLMDITYNALVDRMNENVAFDGTQRQPTCEEMLAFFLIQVIFTWHGNPDQRRFAWQKYHLLIALAHRARLFEPLSAQDVGEDKVSHLHQVGRTDSRTKPWNWTNWIEQEKRNRCAFTLLLLDTAYIMYFNVPPTLRPQDIHLTLPSDDDAWDAPNEVQCAAALGLTGDTVPSATAVPRRPQQFEFLAALRVLMTPGMDLTYCCTNTQAKFVLIHALHSQIWLYHRYGVDNNPSIINDWIRPLTADSAGTDPYATAANPAEIMRDNLLSSLESWKKAWYLDLPVQFPNPADRVGFSRDGVPYYWLAKRLLREPTREMAGFREEGRTENVGFVAGIMEQIRTHIAATGEDVYDENQKADYGIDELNYNMKLLFKPVSDKRLSPLLDHDG